MISDLIVAALIAQAATPAPSPSPSPTPAVALTAAFTGYGFYSNGATGSTQVSNALLGVIANAGKLRASATAGQYAFPAVGFPVVPSNQPGFNTELYSALPLAALSYSFDSHVSIAAGKFATYLGQESDFTYQNLNVQRGIGWVMEPTISRGVQVSYANGPWSIALQENDAYYSGSSGRAIEGLLGWAPSNATSLQFAFIVPGANTPPNPTTAVGNKAEYDLMFARQIGKLQILPYVLYVNSPQSANLGYTSSENAIAAALLASWTFSPQISLPLRYEYAANSSTASERSPNADLVGFGPGSHAQSITITPTLRFGNGGVLRLEYSNVSLSSFAPGLGFGPGGTGSTQNRVGFEFGVLH